MLRTRRCTWLGVLLLIVEVIGVVGAGGIITGLSGCVAPLPPKKITLSERIAFDREIGNEILNQLEPQLSLKKDNQVQSFLKRVAQLLAEKSPDLHIPEAKVLIISEDKSKQKWESFAVPGGHVYISLSVLKSLVYENEVAAVLAIQMGRLLKEQVLEYIRKNPATDSSTEPSTVVGEGPLKTLRTPQQIVFFDKGGMFEFTEKQDEDALDAAFSIQYAGGYDTRGIITVLQALIQLSHTNPEIADNQGRIAGLRAADLPELLDYARKRIVFQPPLRNPIVQSPEFLAIRQRLGKL